ncbi:hypothetical protein [Psychroserpens sp. SPM9]|uniref:hypothetical protein n=1 Tax=Psychroserpens sp. SPM9 TaxID=2975598 RepID=UPI0021A6A20C|nr:hypothetical protein [Psychroserpens sp. SPM9]MDG5490647.1 hypothetical protein [Psychroserpens sp. SPM9]
MKDKLISYLTYGNRFYSIEQSQANGDVVCYGIELKKTKNQVDVEKCFQFDSLQEASKYIPKGKPAFLVVNNDQVITKKIESRETDPLKLVHHVFANLKIDEFYYEVLQQDNIHFVSICRKTYVDELFEQYKSKNISVINFSLGNLMIASIAHFISEDHIHSSNAIISKADDQIIDIQPQKEIQEVNYNCNETTLAHNELLTFSSALSLITKTKVTTSVFSKSENHLLKDFKEKRFFTKFMKIGLSFLFVLLLGNFFLFNNYYDKVSELKVTAQVLNSSKSKVFQLNKKVQKTQKMVEDVLKSNASKSSYYADAIITSLPDQILLSELNYQPLLKKIKAQKPIHNDTNAIIVSGASSESILVSQWISELEALKWIKHIEIISFDDTFKSSSEFSFKIYIDDDSKN